MMGALREDGPSRLSSFSIVGQEEVNACDLMLSVRTNPNSYNLLFEKVGKPPLERSPLFTLLLKGLKTRDTEDLILGAAGMAKRATFPGLFARQTNGLWWHQPSLMGPPAEFVEHPLPQGNSAAQAF